MTYHLRPLPSCIKQLKKMKKKHPLMFLRLKKKFNELRNNPFLGKPLRNVLKGRRSVHVDPFIIVYTIEGNDVIVLYVKHHKEAY